ncbi:MAG: hypothetical protein DI534_04115 [Leifsonia xyli]|nr:MAG: hypothetical protein DI534_04115 [Leifsonia xyli]
MTKPTRIALSILAVIALALGGGFLGAKLAGSGGGTGGSSDVPLPGSFIEAIKSRGELRVGIAEAAPLTTMEADANGVKGGPFTLPLQNLAKQLGVKYVAVPATWSNIVAGLQAGQYDFAAYLDDTLERATSIQFSNPVLVYQAVLVVEADSPYNSIGDIVAAGAQIASPQGDAANAALTAEGASLLEVGNFQEGTAALDAGRVAALSCDLGTAGGIVGADSTKKIIVPDPIYYQSASGFGVPENIDPRSLQIINIAIQDAQDDGELTAAFKAVGYREVGNLGDWQK